MTENERPVTPAQNPVQDPEAGPAQQPAADPEQWVQEALEKAELFRRKRRYQEGIELMLDALQCKVQLDMVYYRLGNLYFDAGDLARAEYAYRRAIETNPHHVNAHHNLAVVYKKTGRIHDSVRMRKRAARLEAGGLIGRSLVRATPPVFAKPLAETMPAGSGVAGSGVAVEDGVGMQDERELEEPYDESFHPLRDDPEGFRRFGNRVALAGLVVLLVFGVLYLGFIYIIGYWIF